MLPLPVTYVKVQFGIIFPPLYVFETSPETFALLIGYPAILKYIFFVPAKSLSFVAFIVAVAFPMFKLL